MTKNKERIFYFDLIRALAIILVILVHTSKWFIDYQIPHSTLWQLPTYLGLIGNIGVQLFFMISGALLLNKKYDLKDFFKRRFSRILIPFVFWIIIIVLFKIFVLGHASDLSSIINMIFFKGFVWFIWVLFGLYLFTPVINSYIREYKFHGCELFLVFWIITVILNSIGHYPIKNIELRYFSGFLGYMVLGWYLSNKKFRLSDKSLMIFGLMLFIISSLVAFYWGYNQISFGIEYKVSILPVLQGAGLFLLIKYFSDYSQSNKISLTNKIYTFIKDSVMGKIVLSISLCSYGMYLTHYFFIWIIRNFTNIYARNPFKWALILFILTILFSWGLICMCSKIPYLKKFSGV